MQYLKFISDDDLIYAIDKVVRKIRSSNHDATKHLHKNVLDPFSAIFQGVTNSLSYNMWLEQEKARQTQKSMQNSIGDFHQDILGSIIGWKNLGVSGGLDVLNEEMKIIAEIKNKFNTTKGNHKTEIYDAIEAKLSNKKYSGFTGYYVEIIPQSRKTYNKPFTPSDNKVNKQRPINEKIRIIDGASFYSLATGSRHALKELFGVVPVVLKNVYKYKISKKDIADYGDLFERAYLE